MKCLHMLSFSMIEADLRWSLISLPLMLLMQRKGWDFGEWSLFFPAFHATADIQQPLMLISNNNNDGKCWQIAFFSLLYFPPFAFLSMPLCRHSPQCFLTPVCCCASIVSLRGGDPVSVGCISSPALYSGGDLDSQSIFPLQLSQQTPKVVSRLFSRSDINLALPFYIKNACIVKER